MALFYASKPAEEQRLPGQVLNWSLSIRPHELRADFPRPARLGGEPHVSPARYRPFRKLRSQINMRLGFPTPSESRHAGVSPYGRAGKAKKRRSRSARRHSRRAKRDTRRCPCPQLSSCGQTLTRRRLRFRGTELDRASEGYGLHGVRPFRGDTLLHYFLRAGW